MENNLTLWNLVATPPKEALKKITGGRLSGMTDINPQWRYKVLTEVYGPCGIGWKYTVDRKWTENGPDGVVMAFVDISLYVKYPDKAEWRDPIPGHGGSMLVAKESTGLRASDEGFKMATTDALSVACKMLGIGSDVYEGKMDSNRPTETKYDRSAEYNQTHGETPRQQQSTYTPHPTPTASKAPVAPPASAGKVNNAPIPSVTSVNNALKVITAEQYEKISHLLKEKGITQKQWKFWLTGLYGISSAPLIKAEKFAEIWKIISESSDAIKNYVPREPGQD